MSTPAEKRLIEKLRKSSGKTAHIRGAEVRTARRLEERGIVRLTDDGHMTDSWGHVDGERWTAELLVDIASLPTAEVQSGDVATSEGGVR